MDLSRLDSDYRPRVAVAAGSPSICKDGAVPTEQEEPAHDVLAAEMYAMPAPDPTIHHGPVVLPGDLTGEQEPRDVLAAEEFALPAGPPHPLGRVDGGSRSRGRAKHLAAGGAVAFLVLRALRRR
jgi:hypothetical protein